MLPSKDDASASAAAARAEIRKRQNRDSARRSREKRKSHLRGVAESVERQSRRVRELDARVAQLEALVHRAVRSRPRSRRANKPPLAPKSAPLPGASAPSTPTTTDTATATATNSDNNVPRSSSVPQSSSLPTELRQPAIPSDFATTSLHVPLPSATAPVLPSTNNVPMQPSPQPQPLVQVSTTPPSLPSPGVVLVGSTQSLRDAQPAEPIDSSIGSNSLGNVQTQHVAHISDSAVPLSVSTPFGGLPFAMDPWSMDEGVDVAVSNGDSCTSSGSTGVLKFVSTGSSIEW